MKNILKKQSGYTLVWVLLIVVIIGVLTPVIVSKVLSSKLQVQKTEKAIQLENVRQMGITYMESVINLANEKVAAEEIDSLLDSKQYKDELQSKIIEIDSGFRNEVLKVLKVNAHQFRLKTTAYEVRGEEEVVVKYTVTASLNGGSSETRVTNEEVVIRVVKE